MATITLKYDSCSVMDLKQKFKIFRPLIRNKYVITILVFIVWMLFIDQTSFIDRFSLVKNIKLMEVERERLQNEIKSNRETIKELQSISENLEKFAREEYLMKKPDENIFIVIYE
jgi:cell division protein FtsB